MVWYMTFVWLLLVSMLSIFLHELAHHLLGRPSEVGLAHNYPLVPLTLENRTRSIVGTLAGPTANLVLGLVCYAGYHWLGGWGWYFPAAANLGLTLFAAVVNLLVDTVNRKPANDLQEASHLLGLPMLVLPALHVGLTAPPLYALWKVLAVTIGSGPSAVAFLFGSYLLAGLILMGVDSVFRVRFRII
ncbi:MAG TPA: hypothetical protein VD973_00550 [Symbiobacteriaceae bacterium]|nr:hypothetical protein [Symbiobacteriaceae bacterium]